MNLFKTQIIYIYYSTYIIIVDKYKYFIYIIFKYILSSFKICKNS